MTRTRTIAACDEAARAEIVRGAFAGKLSAISDAFAVWLQRDGGLLRPLPMSADTLAGAEAAAAANAAHGDMLYIQHTAGVTGMHTLHIYRVRRSSKSFVRRDALDGAYHVRVGMLYPDPVTPPIRLNAAFDPKTPFVWTPGCDAVGHDEGILS